MINSLVSVGRSVKHIDSNMQCISRAGINRGLNKAQTLKDFMLLMRVGLETLAANDGKLVVI